MHQVRHHPPHPSFVPSPKLYPSRCIRWGNLDLSMRAGRTRSQAHCRYDRIPWLKTITYFESKSCRKPYGRWIKQAPHKMSVTTTANARLSTTRHYLADYDLHHSQPSTSSPAPAPNAHASTPQPPPDQSEWEDRWRRVPAFRPAVNQVDEQRDTYTSGVERNFVRVMFGGEHYHQALNVSLQCGAATVSRVGCLSLTK